MKTFKPFWILLLLVMGLTACEPAKEPNAEPETPPAVAKFVGNWNFAYLQEASIPLPITLEFLQKMGFPIKNITLTIEGNGQFNIKGIGDKNLEGTFVLQGEDLLMTLSPDSFKEVEKQFTADDFMAKYSNLEGIEKVELVLGKLTISEVEIPLNNTSMFFKK